MSFRPLAGIMVLILSFLTLFVALKHVVSVPLRGLWFLSEDSDFPSQLKNPAGVSVPLRGLWFLS